MGSLREESRYLDGVVNRGEADADANRANCLDDARGVLHSSHRQGYPGLYVADGSIIPTALAVNPSMTISALAERIAFWMIHGRELEPGDPQTPANSS